jgi:hypothetical protein
VPEGHHCPGREIIVLGEHIGLEMTAPAGESVQVVGPLISVGMSPPNGWHLKKQVSLIWRIPEQFPAVTKPFISAWPIGRTTLQAVVFGFAFVKCGVGVGGGGGG